MKQGDEVRIYPHGSPDQPAIARVFLYGDRLNGVSCVLMFEDKPLFATVKSGGGSKILMFLYRLSVGPWVELIGGGHYEIEEVTNDEATRPLP